MATLCVILGNLEKEVKKNLQESLTEKEKLQEKSFDYKAGKNNIYHVGGRSNRNHAIKIKTLAETLQLDKN